MAAVPPRLSSRSRRSAASLRRSWHARVDVAGSRASVEPPQTPGWTPRASSRSFPATTEMLFAMGAGDRLAGVSNYDRFPPEVERLPRVGGLLDPDVERVLSLKPDLVIVYDTQTDLKRQLERAQDSDVPLRPPRPARHHARRCGRSARGSARGRPPTPRRTRIEQQLAAVGRRVAGPAAAEDAARLRAGAGHAAPHQRERRLRVPPRRARARRRRRRARRSAASSRST